MKIDLSRFAGRFRQETRDNLSLFDNAIARIDTALNRMNPGRDELLREMMRLAHAIKGSARMLGFSNINGLCHALEELLITLRDKEVISHRNLDLVVEARKGIDRLLINSENEESDLNAIPKWLETLLLNLHVGALAASESEVEPDPIPFSPPLSRERSEKDVIVSQSSPPKESWREATVRVDVETIDDLLNYGRELTQALDGLGISYGQVERVRVGLEATIETRRNATNRTEGLTIKEADDLLRSLTLLSLNLRDRIADVDRSVRQIDSGAVELRMRPIAELFETIPLQVRDLSRSLAKEVDVEFTGETVRFDGRIVELLREPLLHLIRNSLDHGIETPAEREMLGKSSRGRLTIGAYENAGWARVMIADDGKGIDSKAVWSRAQQLGLVSRDEAMPSDTKKILGLIFDDRFTIRSSANDVSGRGVGLAAVKRRLQELRGDVSIESVPGMGAKFTLLMPTSLSSQRALVTQTRIDGERAYFAFPTAMVRGTSRQDNSFEEKLADPANPDRSEAMRAMSLAGLLQGKQIAPEPNEAYLVLCSDGHRAAALAIEQIVAESEVVIEPLPHIARTAEFIAGAAPLTSEVIMLVINVPKLLNAALTGQN